MEEQRRSSGRNSHSGRMRGQTKMANWKVHIFKRYSRHGDLPVQLI